MNKKRLLLSLLVVILAGLIVAPLILRSSNNTSNNIAKVVTYSTDTPDEVKPDTDYEWKGGTTDPKKIIIPSLGVDGYIQNVGIDQNNEVAVPDNVHLAGWFVDSVHPGGKGLSIIDGHVDLRPNHAGAIFQHLDTIKENAEVTIVFGDDSTKKFKVVQVQDVPLEEAASVLFSSRPNAVRQLNLVTCSGAYDKSTNRLDRRIIVSTELVTNP